MTRGFFYGACRDVQHYFLLKEKEERAKRGDSPSMRRIYSSMHSPLPDNALPIATKFGELIARQYEVHEKSLVKNTE